LPRNGWEFRQNCDELNGLVRRVNALQVVFLCANDGNSSCCCHTERCVARGLKQSYSLSVLCCMEMTLAIQQGSNGTNKSRISPAMSCLCSVLCCYSQHLSAFIFSGYLAATGEGSELCMSCHAEIDLDAQTGDWDWMTLGVTSLWWHLSVRSCGSQARQACRGGAFMWAFLFGCGLACLEPSVASPD
jgi:hypothetical protein